MSTYAAFLARKAQLSNAGGFQPVDLPQHLFDFQAHLVDWAVRQGRGAIFGILHRCIAIPGHGTGHSCFCGVSTDTPAAPPSFTGAAGPGSPADLYRPPG